jgi:hypothetical protein
MSYLPYLDNLTLEKLIARFHGPNPEGDGYIYYDEVAIKIREKGKIGNRWLTRTLKIMDDSDEERLRAVLLALRFSHDSEFGGIVPLASSQKRAFSARLLAYLDDERPFIVGDTIEALRCIRAKDALDRVLRLRDYPHYYVRCQVLSYMQALHHEISFPILTEALKDEEYWVREEACDQLSELGNADALPYLRSLLIDSSPYVQQAAKNAIESIEDWIQTNAVSAVNNE